MLDTLRVIPERRTKDVRRRSIHLCDRCKARLFYTKAIDAWWCSRCDRWAESTCGDPGCRACAARPARPSMLLRRAVA